MRMSLFTQLVDALGGIENVTTEEAKAIANYVNVCTGRGHFRGDTAAAAQFLSTYFFSPRFVASRFQLLLGQPLWGGNARTRKLIAKEYVRILAGESTFYSMLGLFGYLTADDDDLEKPIFEWNPQSGNFGKVRMGGVVIDAMSGLSQCTVLMSRLGPPLLSGGKLEGYTKRSTGEIVPITGEDRPFKGMTGWGALSGFLRTKLAPIPSAIINVATKENLIGDKTNILNESWQLITPLSFRDIYQTMQAKGFSRKMTLSMLVLLGYGAQNYQDATPESFARKIAEHPQLRGYNKKSREYYDYTTEVGQIVAEAKKRGLKPQDLGQALIPYMQGEGNKPETIVDSMSRLYSRFHED
jgi:hypothetical protein